MRSGTIAFLAGILYCQQLRTLPEPFWAPVLLCVLPLAAWLLRHLPEPIQPGFIPFDLRRYDAMSGRRLLTLLLWAVTGFAWTLLRAGLVLESGLPAELEGRDLRVIGVVAGLVETQEHGQRFVFDIESLAPAAAGTNPDLATGRHTAGFRVRLSLYRQHIENKYKNIKRDHPGLQPSVGQRWQLHVRLKRPHGFANPGGFDYEGWLFQHRIRATGYVRRPEQARYLGEAGWPYSLERLRARVRQALQQAIPAGAERAVILALAIGERSELDGAHWAVLTRTGTNHLLAISGLHIGLVAGLGFWLGAWLWSRRSRALLWLPAAKAGGLLALLAGTFYAALAGFSLPTQRALIMLCVVVAALWWQRRSSASHTLALALLAVLVFDPLAVMATGLWLSFAAVACIVYVMEGRLQRPGRVQSWLRIQGGLGLGLLPLLAGYFQRASLIAPLANLFAVPVVGLFIVPLTLAGVMLVLIWPRAGQALLGLDAWLVARLWQVLDGLSGFPLAEWVAPMPGSGALIVAGLGVLLLLAPRGVPARWLGTVLLLPLLWPLPDRPLAGEARFTLLDVGQGLAAVVETRHHVLVYDTGPRFSSRFDTGRAVVAPYLIARGYRAIDTLIISHGDNDHRGGTRSLLAAIPAARVLSSVPRRLAADGVQDRVETCRRGQQWRWDGVVFRLLAPQASRGRGNNDSCVLAVQAGPSRLLLSGDIEAAAETELLANDAAGLRADILVVPHHGSRTSSTPGFVQAVAPAYALFATGYRNRYHFPYPPVAARYRAQHARLLETAHSGALVFRLGARGVGEPLRIRVLRRRYWYTP